MGSTCCKSPYGPKMPDLGKFFMNCPLMLCPDVSKEEPPPIRTRKFCCSDISNPLPLGTVIPPPKRPPRKKRRKISRCRSVSDLDAPSLPTLVRSKSTSEIHFSILENQQYSSEKCSPSLVHLSSLILPIGVNEENTIISNYPNTIENVISSQPSKLETKTPEIQELITQNKKTFLAKLLEENNNLQNSDNVKNINTSRKSSITESLREFESSLYDMLQDERNAEDERKESSISSHHIVSR